MSYGLYDGDLLFYKNVPFFNLELMKLSTYYKRRREIVNLSPDFAPHMYSNFIVRQDYPFFNPYIANAENVSFGGRAYDDGKYKPLDLEIEKSKPDVGLYDKIGAKVVNGIDIKTIFSTMRRAEHLRLSLDEKTIWPQYEQQLRRETGGHGIIFHDYDLNAIDDSLEIVKELLDSIPNPSARRVGMKFPVQLNTEQEFFDWAALPPMGHFFFLQYNNIPTLELVKELKELTKGTSVLKQTIINVTKNQNYETFIKTGIINLFETILDLRREGTNFLLIYDKDFFLDDRWIDVMDFIQRFNYHIHDKIDKTDYFNRIAPYESFYDYMKRCTKEHILYHSIIPKEKVKKTFQFVRENNYDLFVDFYEYYGEKK